MNKTAVVNKTARATRVLIDFSPFNSDRRLSRVVRPEEGMYLAHRQGNPLLGLFPREYAHFGLWREHRGLHGDGVRMRRDIIRQDLYRRLAIANEIACCGE